MVLLGASGDLTARLLLPAVAELAAVDALPPGFQVVGAAKSEWSPEDFREHIAQALIVHAPHITPNARDAVVRMLDYRPLDVTHPAEIADLVGGEARANTLVYLALPPGLFEPVLSALGRAGLRSGDAVAIEKPFGTDLASARQLNRLLRTRLPEPTTFRIDHFLTNELVHRIAALRFLNRVFEPVWNGCHVERVDIRWLERLTLEGRAVYYDTAGALKDMVQNHLMEVMAFVLMEQPARLDDASLRGNRVEALRAVATPSAEDIRRQSVRARYTAGRIGERTVPSYVDEPGVVPERNTETYASITFGVENLRWEGVPFTLSSGKAMGEYAAEIAVHFRPLPGGLRQQYPGAQPNVLRLGLEEPYIRLATVLNSSGNAAAVHDLELLSGPVQRSPYADLIAKMLARQTMLFIRGDEAEEAWRLTDPVLSEWHRGGVPMQTYPAGGAPPDPARPGD